jgi:hypothetical protein
MNEYSVVMVNVSSILILQQIIIKNNKMKKTILSIGVVCTLMGFGVGYSVSEQTKTNEQEIINTCEDLIEWITNDTKDGYVDSSRADGYIGNIEGIMKRQEEIIDERNS